jgi:hypothetical protein
LQGKGGVGKSLIATILAEFLADKVDDLQCFDTDPVNPTFTSYKAFGVKRIELFENGHINAKAFDHFMVSIYEPGQSGLVDNGATTFIPLLNYIRESAALEMLVAAGKAVFVHIVIAGGDALAETMDGFFQIASRLPPGVQAVVWLNELHGKVERNGVEFEELAVYKDVEDRISGIIRLPAPTSDMFAKDFQDLRKKRVSFQEAIDGKDFNVMERQRIAMIKRDLFDRVAAVL